MARLTLNKSALQKERDRLRLLQRLLPSLDLKRRQLLLELQRAREALREGQAALERLEAEIGQQLPMLADREIDVDGLVSLKAVRVRQENVVGVRLPVLEDLTFTVLAYSRLAKPHWVDVLVDRLKEAVEFRVKLKVAAKRVEVLDRALKRITQRVNLFDKILIPAAKQNIKKIQVFLSDAERAAVVRAKLAKSRRQRGPVAGEESAR